MTETATLTPDEEKDERRQAFGRLLLILLAAAVATKLTGVTGTVIVIVAVLLMIMLHEFGHFITAKWGGMKVTEFFVGFGPRLWSVKKGETEYGVKALPVGGYCRIIGMHNLEEVPPEDEPRAYRNQSFPKRLAVAVAGSATHFMLAFLLLFGLNAFVGVEKLDPMRYEISEISRLSTGQSPAKRAGLRPGDKVLSVDGRRFAETEDVTAYIKRHPGDTLQFEIQRASQRFTVGVTPVDLSNVEVVGDRGLKASRPTGFVGVRIGPAVKVEKAGPLAAIGRAAGDEATYAKETFKALGKLVSFQGISSYGEQLTGKPGATTPNEDDTRFLSPVGLVRIASEVSSNGIRDVLVLLIAINIFVGIFNMVPLLPLDGGHVAIAVYERIRSRRGRMYHADVAKMLPFAYAMMMLLVFLGISSLYLDIVRPLSVN